MANIKGKETKPEISVRKWLYQRGIRYRKNVANLPGKPDIVINSAKTIVFVNGCLWHGHDGCKRAKLPVSNLGFWQEKIDRNRARDVKNYNLLNELGYFIIVIWQCEIAKEAQFYSKMNDCLNIILGRLNVGSKVKL